MDDSCTKAQLINAFDNTVLYTDSFISNVIDQVRDKKAIVFMPPITASRSARIRTCTARRAKWRHRNNSACR